MTEYKIVTIEDILITIPTERIKTFMCELTSLLLQMKCGYDAAKRIDPDSKIIFPKPLIWKDDGEGKVSVNHFFNNRLFFKTTEKVDSAEKA